MMRVWRIWHPDALRKEPMKDLFLRSFADPKLEMDADEVREYLRTQLLNGGCDDRLFVAKDAKAGLCGLSIVSLGTYPLAPHPFISFFAAESRGARRALIEASSAEIRSRGFTRCAIINETGRSNRAHMRLFREFGKGDVRGSMIIYEAENPYGG